MKYRKLGRTGLEISEISMGLEHLLPKEQSVVTETIRAAIEGGVNYFDCFSTKDFEKSSDTNEQFTKLGKAFEILKVKREKIYLVHLVNAAHSAEVINAGVECFLREVKTDYIDVFVIACCDKLSLYDDIITGGGSLLEYAKKLQKEKKVRFIGLSTHSRDIAHKTLEHGGFDVIMYPVNPAFDVITDEENYISEDLGKLWDAAYDYKSDNINNEEVKLVRKDIYTECLKNNIGLIAMKPFGGGFLFKPDINTGFTPVNLISYALKQTGISAVIPGCSSKEQIEDILRYYSLSEEELDFSKAMSESRWNIKGCCQYCNHCLPCAAGIDVGLVNRIIDNSAKDEYNALEIKASACLKCGECECEERCPFGVKVTERMDLAVKLFS